MPCCIPAAPDIPTIRNVMISTKAGSNRGNIDVIWKVSNMKLYLTNNTNVVKNLGKQIQHVAVYQGPTWFGW